MKQLCKVLHAMCEEADTPIALSVVIQMRYGLWDFLSYEIDPKSYVSDPHGVLHFPILGWARYALDQRVISFLSKVRGISVNGHNDATRKKAAIENRLQTERHCASINWQFMKHANHEIPYFNSMDDLRFHETLVKVRKMVRVILGRVPALEELSNCRFGPGATFADKGNLTTTLDKLTSNPTVTAQCWELVRHDWAKSAWPRALERLGTMSLIPQIVRGNRFTVVPKNWKKDRGIAVEPSINVFYQLGVGSWIRSRLKRVYMRDEFGPFGGIDILNGQTLHRLLARIGSLSEEWATIDLSNASDTVARLVVKALLPSDWYSLLDSLRSHETQYEDGTWVRNEQFSSMGNGFTFELETLIFYCIARVVSDDTAYVYGDDIIVANDAYQDVAAALNRFGFILNRTKSFNSGGFRESCGGDYFHGKDVRPVFARSLPESPADWFTIANFFNEGSRAWHRAVDNIPTRLRSLRGPSCLGDIVLHSNDPRTWSIKVKESIRYIKSLIPQRSAIPLHHFHPEVVYAGALYGVDSDGPLPRGEPEGYKVKWVPYS